MVERARFDVTQVPAAEKRRFAHVAIDTCLSLANRGLTPARLVEAAAGPLVAWCAVRGADAPLVAALALWEVARRGRATVA